MFKRPRTQREALPATSWAANKRLKEDCNARERAREQDYFKVPQRQERNAGEPARSSRERERYNRLKVKPPALVCRLQESDSSSVASEGADSHDELDIKEQQRYNQLKLKHPVNFWPSRYGSNFAWDAADSQMSRS